MTGNLKEKERIGTIHLSNYCNCDHCMGIRRQQQESELNWLKQHQIFDR